MSQVEAPNSLRKWDFWDSAYYSEWPKVADAVIEAQENVRQNRLMSHAAASERQSIGVERALDRLGP